MEKRVLLVNKFYYPRGGDCIVTLNTEALLRDKEMEVGIYAMQYPENIDYQYSNYFASQISFSGGIGAKVKALKRTMGMGDVKTSFSRLLDDFKPRVVHLHNIHSYLSPVLAEMAHKRGLHVVWTLHDYKLLCPAYTCTRDDKPCELCYRDKSHVLRNKCMKGSTVASLIAWLEAKRWNRERIERSTDAFICPSQFMASKMEQGGFDKRKLHVLNNFVDPTKLERFKAQDLGPRKDYYCYVGRLSHEKGVETLLRAAALLPMELRIAGTGPLAEQLREHYASHTHIKFLGHLNARQVSALLAEARFSVIPSQCYENNPLSVIESLCSGTPVVGARIGGIPELIDETSGMPYAWNDGHALAEALERAWEKPWDYASIKATAIARFSPEAHYRQLMRIYEYPVPAL